MKLEAQKRGVEILSYKIFEKASKHADRLEWTRAAGLNATKMTLSMPIDRLQMTRYLCGQVVHVSWCQLSEGLQL